MQVTLARPQRFCLSCGCPHILGFQLTLSTEPRPATRMMQGSGLPALLVCCVLVLPSVRGRVEARRARGEICLGAVALAPMVVESCAVDAAVAAVVERILLSSQGCSMRSSAVDESEPV